MEPERFSYVESRAIADGYLVPVPFGLFARVTRQVWDVYADRAGGADRTLEALRQTWSLVAAQHAERNGMRILRQFGRSVWLVPNELGGLTLMFPDDQ